MPVPMSKCVCARACVGGGAHMTRHVPNLLVSMHVCVMEPPPPPHIGVLYLPNMCECFYQNVVLVSF